MELKQKADCLAAAFLKRDFFSVRNEKIAEKDKKDQDWFLYPVRIKGYAAYVAAHEKGDR